MIKFIKRDFNNVRGALGYLLKKDCPFGIALFWYIIVGSIALLFAPIIFIIYKLEMRKLRNLFKEEA